MGLSVAFPRVFRLARTKRAEFANFSMQKACLPRARPALPRLPAFGRTDEERERADRPSVKIQGATREKHAVTVTHARANWTWTDGRG